MSRRPPHTNKPLVALYSRTNSVDSSNVPPSTASNSNSKTHSRASSESSLSLIAPSSSTRFSLSSASLLDELSSDKENMSFPRRSLFSKSTPRHARSSSTSSMSTRLTISSSSDIHSAPENRDAELSIDQLQSLLISSLYAENELEEISARDDRDAHAQLEHLVREIEMLEREKEVESQKLRKCRQAVAEEERIARYGDLCHELQPRLASFANLLSEADAAMMTRLNRVELQGLTVSSNADLISTLHQASERIDNAWQQLDQRVGIERLEKIAELVPSVNSMLQSLEVTQTSLQEQADLTTQNAIRQSSDRANDMNLKKIRQLSE